VIHKHCKTCP